MLPDLHTDFSTVRSGGLVFPSLSEFSTVSCDPHSQRLWYSQYSRNRCFSGTLLLFWWSSRCWQFDLWFTLLQFFINILYFEARSISCLMGSNFNSDSSKGIRLIWYPNKNDTLKKILFFSALSMFLFLKLRYSCFIMLC